MGLQYIFYKKTRPGDARAEVLKESGSFNNVLNRTSARKVYRSLQDRGNLLQRVSLAGFMEYIVSPEADLFEELHLVRERDGKRLVRLVPRSLPVSPYAIALSLSPHSYISHYSALYLHGLTLNIPKPIFVKKRRTKPKPRRQAPEELTQEMIDSAFSRPARTTGSIYTFEHEGKTQEVYLIEQSAGVDKGISSLPSPRAPAGVPVSSVEKTLIECAVKTNYAGGPSEVLDAFRRAKDRLKILRMMRLLMDEDYLFPYEKNILFYMDRAGYTERQKGLVRGFLTKGRDGFNTYLEAGMRRKRLDARIGVYYPEGMGPR